MSLPPSVAFEVDASPLKRRLSSSTASDNSPVGTTHIPARRKEKQEKKKQKQQQETMSTDVLGLREALNGINEKRDISYEGRS